MILLTGPDFIEKIKLTSEDNHFALIQAPLWIDSFIIFACVHLLIELNNRQNLIVDFDAAFQVHRQRFRFGRFWFPFGWLDQQNGKLIHSASGKPDWIYVYFLNELSDIDGWYWWWWWVENFHIVAHIPHEHCLQPQGLCHFAVRQGLHVKHRFRKFYRADVLIQLDHFVDVKLACL